jgi:PhzF family phenazine biosynthesis protein
VIRQECAAGLISVRRLQDQLAFAAPPLLRSGPLDTALLSRIIAALALPEASVQGHQWVDNGPGWCALLLDSAQRVLAVEPDYAALRGLSLGLVAPQAPGSATDFEVRAFVPGLGVPEDPATGSLNAGIAQWLMGQGLAPERYIASQGMCLGREGRLTLQREGDTVWVGGSTETLICGEASFS